MDLRKLSMALLAIGDELDDMSIIDVRRKIQKFDKVFEEFCNFYVDTGKSPGALDRFKELYQIMRDDIVSGGKFNFREFDESTKKTIKESLSDLNRIIKN